MMSRPYRFVAIAAALLVASASAAHAALILQPLTSFGNNGWLAPADATYLQGANVQRGMTYNQLNNRVYVVDRNGGNFIRVLNGDTGALVSSLDMTGVSGGTFPINMIDVDDQGVIYAANLVVGGTLTIYRWANEAAAPTIAFNGATNRTRTGDSFAVIGSGASTQIVSAGGTGAGETYALFSTADGLTYTVSNPAAAGAPNGAFRLGIDFAGPGTVLGKATSNNLFSNPTAGGSATGAALTSAGEGPIAYDAVDALLASIDVNSNLVRLYDAANLAAPALLDDENLTTAFVANTNGVGDLKFGRVNGQLRLY
ncbi:MAG TPA: DUF4623 domain-containing protein, partial [Lacipirellulaceae bacterium]|nr:DUF4623 domain-containing protein [Lacipirellulaceae bacterium]